VNQVAAAESVRDNPARRTASDADAAVRAPAVTEHRVTQLLQRASIGDDQAVADLFPLVYDDLRRVAAKRLRGEQHNQSLEATGLVHEAFIRLVPGAVHHRPQNRAHFFAVAARAMRQVLVDHARVRAAAKRGGDAARVTLTDSVIAGDNRSVDVLAVDEALRRLAALSERQAKVVELRYFAGASEREIADVLGISTPTVKRDWQVARAWLRKELERVG